MNKRVMIGAAAVLAGVVAIAGVHYGNPYRTTNQALNEFGWAGSWSPDCGMTRLPHSVRQIHWWGAPTSSVQSLKSDDARSSKFTITSAKMLADNKIAINGEEDWTDKEGRPQHYKIEASYEKVNGKIVPIRVLKEGIASRDAEAGDLTFTAVKAGHWFSHIAARDGMAYGPDFKPLGKVSMELCRE